IRTSTPVLRYSGLLPPSFFLPPPTTTIFSLSLHDALPISIQCASVCSQADSFPDGPAPAPSAHGCDRFSADPPSGPNAVLSHITVPRKTMRQAPWQSEIQRSPYSSPHRFILLLLFYH